MLSSECSAIMDLSGLFKPMYPSGFCNRVWRGLDVMPIYMLFHIGEGCCKFQVSLGEYRLYSVSSWILVLKALEMNV